MIYDLRAPESPGLMLQGITGTNTLGNNHTYFGFVERYVQGYYPVKQPSIGENGLSQNWTYTISLPVIDVSLTGATRADFAGVFETFVAQYPPYFTGQITCDVQFQANKVTYAVWNHIRADGTVFQMAEVGNYQQNLPMTQVYNWLPGPGGFVLNNADQQIPVHGFSVILPDLQLLDVVVYAGLGSSGWSLSLSNEWDIILTDSTENPKILTSRLIPPSFKVFIDWNTNKSGDRVASMITGTLIDTNNLLSGRTAISGDIIYVSSESNFINA